MITRKDLVEALRVIHEADQVTKIVTRAKRIDVHYMSGGRDCLLVLPNPIPNDNNTNTNKNTTRTKHSPTKATNTTTDNRPESADPIRSTKGGENDYP
jgi:hypothetical protein